MEQTYHQERSRETFDNQITQEQLHTRFLLEKIMKVLSLQCRELGLWQVRQYLKAKIEAHVHDAKHIHYYTRTMSDNLPKAYSHADEKLHYICAWCPDKAEAEQIARATEEKKYLIALLDGVRTYQKKKISHTICDSCISSQLFE